MLSKSVQRLTIFYIFAFFFWWFSDFIATENLLIVDFILWLKEHFYWPLYKLVKTNLFSPVFYLAMIMILGLERAYPAKPNQKIFSVSFAHDTVWLLLRTVFEVNFIFIYVAWLKDLYGSHLSFLSFTMIAEWPDWTRFVWAVLLGDFFGWLHHFIKHNVPMFWEFHKIHHSQKHLNLFTDLRIHVFELVISRPIVTFPMLMFAINTPQIQLYNVFYVWFTRAYHANIKTNLGPLKHVLVTPQSHRIHHSLEKPHYDKNYGVLFTFWDHLFKTQYTGYEEYPDTGIHDDEFPHETTAKGLSLIVTPILQLIYPFKVLGRQAVRRLRDITRRVKEAREK